MNGVHDMGGMHGFGPVMREENEPVFHDPWEGRVLGMLREFGARFPARAPGAARDIIENIEPARYLTTSYYERFLEVVVQRAIAEGVITPQELEARMQVYEKEPDKPVPANSDPEAVARARARFATQLYPEPEGAAPRFSEGDAVLVRNLNWQGHNRLPRYIRGKHGFIERVNGLYATEDAHADALGPNPQTVYTVRFEGREVWGPETEPNMQLYLELWEGYLEPSRID
jgi:nitrile hydratase subunit beta